MVLNELSVSSGVVFTKYILHYLVIISELLKSGILSVLQSLCSSIVWNRLCSF